MILKVQIAFFDERLKDLADEGKIFVQIANMPSIAWLKLARENQCPEAAKYLKLYVYKEYD